MVRVKSSDRFIGHLISLFVSCFEYFLKRKAKCHCRMTQGCSKKNLYYPIGKSCFLVQKAFWHCQSHGNLTERHTHIMDNTAWHVFQEIRWDCPKFCISSLVWVLEPTINAVFSMKLCLAKDLLLDTGRKKSDVIWVLKESHLPGGNLCVDIFH